MKRHVSTWVGLAAAVSVAAWVLAGPASAFAQDRASATAPSGGGSSAAAPSGGSGGGNVSSGGGGGGMDRAGAGGGGFDGGGRNRADGGHGGATGGSGIAMPRTGDYSGSGGASGRTSATPGRGRDGDERSGVPEFSRPRDGADRTGTAVSRPAGSTPTRGGGSNYVIVPGGYYGGYGYPYGGYGGYGGYYGGYYSGYYDPFFDPWYGGYYSSYSYDPQSSYSSFGADEGALRLKIKPRDAEVYVDGYYVGTVDEFDGMFQRLHIEPGAHHIEVRAAGYATLTFEVKITPEHTTTYQGEMKRIQ